jgi:hypothetical protein
MSEDDQRQVPPSARTTVFADERRHDSQLTQRHSNITRASPKKCKEAAHTALPDVLNASSWRRNTSQGLSVHLRAQEKCELAHGDIRVSHTRMHISRAERHPGRTINLGSVDRNSLQTPSKVRLSQRPIFTKLGITY